MDRKRKGADLKAKMDHETRGTHLPTRVFLREDWRRRHLPLQHRGIPHTQQEGSRQKEG